MICRDYPKFKLTKEERALILADFLPYAETVVIADVPEGLPLIRDQADQMFLILAVVGQAETLVTGNVIIEATPKSYKVYTIEHITF